MTDEQPQHAGDLEVSRWHEVLLLERRVLELLLCTIRSINPGRHSRVKVLFALGLAPRDLRTRPAAIRPEIVGDSSEAKLTASMPHLVPQLYFCQKFRQYRQVCTDLNSVCYNLIHGAWTDAPGRRARVRNWMDVLPYSFLSIKPRNWVIWGGSG